MEDKPVAVDKWMAEQDAQTLAEAEVIKKDKARLGRAAKEAKVMEKKAKQRAVAMSKVANLKKPAKKQTRKNKR